MINIFGIFLFLTAKFAKLIDIQMVLVLALIEASYRVARKAGKWLLNSSNDSLQNQF
jgi:hypothetical protein